MIVKEDTHREIKKISEHSEHYKGQISSQGTTLGAVYEPVH